MPKPWPRRHQRPSPWRWTLGVAAFTALAGAGCSDDDLNFDSGDPRPNAEESGETGVPAGPPESSGRIAAVAPLRMVDVAPAMGLDLTQGNELLPTACQNPYPEVTIPAADDCWIRNFMGGAAIADFDQDGWPDIFLPRAAGPNQLLRNLEGKGFEDVAEDWGLDDLAQHNAAAWVDLDLDGDLDLVISGQGISPHRVYMREVDRFELGSADWQAGLNAVHGVGGTSVQPGDVDLDGRPDLLFMEWTRQFNKRVDESWNVRLLRNLPDAGESYRLEDITRDTDLGDLLDRSEPNQSFSAAFADFDADGLADLFFTADYSHMQFYRGTNAGLELVPESGNEVVKFGMGTAIADIDGDGDLDAYVASIGENIDFPATIELGFEFDRNHLLLNDGSGRFESMELDAGPHTCSFSWGVLAADLNNDGSVDLAATNGWSHPEPLLNESYQSDRNCLFLQAVDDGPLAFSRQSADSGFDDDGQGRGLYAIDFDRDGDLDLLQIRNSDTPRLWRNEGANTRAWLQVVPLSPAGAPDARDALVAVRLGDGPWRLSPVGLDATYLGHGELMASFGFGQTTHDEVDLRVCWEAAGRMLERDALPLRQRVSVSPDEGEAIDAPCMQAIVAD